jgi:hypothetical protein
MILHPGILALLLASALTSALALLAAYHGGRVLQSWDLTSGSERQLTLERKTSLITTLVAYAFGLHVLSLFLFAGTAENVHGLFVGAMCAAGVLNVNGYGYPLLVLKIVNALAAGVWLIVNHADTRAPDYPLIRPKYGLLIVMAPSLVIESILLVAYLGGLTPNVITSCCGSLFSVSADTVSSELAALPAQPMALALGGSISVTALFGIIALRSGRGAIPFALSSLAAFIVAMLSVISFVSPYIYELPSHHCPFCMLKPEYGYVGYFLYLFLLTGAVAGSGAGVLGLFGRGPSLRVLVPALQRRLVVVTLIAYGLFTLLVIILIARSNLVMS